MIRQFSKKDRNKAWKNSVRDIAFLREKGTKRKRTEKKTESIKVIVSGEEWKTSQHPNNCWMKELIRMRAKDLLIHLCLLERISFPLKQTQSISHMIYQIKDYMLAYIMNHHYHQSNFTHIIYKYTIFLNKILL